MLVQLIYFILVLLIMKALFPKPVTNNNENIKNKNQNNNSHIYYNDNKTDSASIIGVLRLVMNAYLTTIDLITDILLIFEWKTIIETYQEFPDDKRKAFEGANLTMIFYLSIIVQICYAFISCAAVYKISGAWKALLQFFCIFIFVEAWKSATKTQERSIGHRDASKIKALFSSIPQLFIGVYYVLRYGNYVLFFIFVCLVWFGFCDILGWFL